MRSSEHATRDFSVEEAELGPPASGSSPAPGATSDEIVELAGDADVILAGSGPRFDAATLARLRCRGIVRSGVGVETIDLEAARAARACGSPASPTTAPRRSRCTP